MTVTYEAVFQEENGETVLLQQPPENFKDMGNINKDIFNSPNNYQVLVKTLQETDIHDEFLNFFERTESKGGYHGHTVQRGP